VRPRYGVERLSPVGLQRAYKLEANHAQR
jgi:hypothetical protein